MSKAIKTSLAIAAAVAGVAAMSASASAYGPERKTYTIDDINRNKLGDQIVFNSITDSVIGDERNFVGAREYTGVNSGKGNEWNGNEITVEDGKEYLIRLYVHNNSTTKAAEGVKVAFSIPTYSSKELTVSGLINVSNPSLKYWDEVTFKSDKSFHLKYVYGSALLENNGIGAGTPANLSDEITTNATNGGVLIGYNALDGVVPGCFEYANYITIRVKAVYDTDYRTENEVRLIGGEKKWSTYVNAKIGDIVEFRVSYKNISETDMQNQVTIRDILPKSLEYVDGTTKLVNANYPSGIVIDQDSIASNGITIGNYGAGSNAYVYFRAKVVEDGLACGKNTLVNWAQGSVGDRTIQDYAGVITNRFCEAADLPDTGPEAIVGGVVATGSIVTAAGYFISSRRALR